MALQKLPQNVQSLFCASQISTYKRVVEELIYNSLDADATSIAIRVNIEDNSIQVIDNGHGISHTGFKILGQKHATSKCVNLTTLKSVPNKYGFRGLALASIVEISKSVKITSRCADSENTWMKSFYKGKEQNISETSPRPSKGTTVDIKGFLYNLKIQKEAIDPLSELNDIKTFLEQLSLVHNNISVSLRDDAKNEIIFKLHKNRNIYKTLHSVFQIEQKYIQELIVQKGEYKVKAYIGKRDNNCIQTRWVYLNGKILFNSEINKIIYDTISKMLRLNLETRKGVKSKTVVQFKNWEQINKLIEKVIQLYDSDIKSKVNNTIQNPNQVENTRKEVTKLMEKILGNNPKKSSILQMHKGVKGKIMKRKPKKPITKLLTKPLPVVNTHTGLEMVQENRKELPKEFDKIDQPVRQLKEISANKKFKKDQSHPTVNETDHKDINKTKIGKSKANKKNQTSWKPIRTKRNPAQITKQHENKTEKHKLLKQAKLETKSSIRLKKSHKIINKKKKHFVTPNTNRKINIILDKFHKDPNGSVKKRCNDLTKKVENIIAQKRKRKIFINETIHYSNVVRDNKNYSIRKKIGEIVIHDYIPKPIGMSLPDDNKGPNREKVSSYDLITTVLKTQEINNSYTERKNEGNKYLNEILSKGMYTLKQDMPHVTLPKLTYESHSYEAHMNKRSHEYNFENLYKNTSPNQQPKIALNKHFITTNSKDNFSINNVKMPRKLYSNRCKYKTTDVNNTGDLSYAIDFSNSKEQPINNHIESPKVNMSLYSPTIQLDNTTYSIDGENRNQIGCTYTMEDAKSNDESISRDDNKYIDTYTFVQRNSRNGFGDDYDCSSGNIKTSHMRPTNESNKINIIFVSESQEPQSKTHKKSPSCDIIPEEICETVHSQEEIEETDIFSKRNDSLFNSDLDIDSFLCNQNAYTYTQQKFPDLVDFKEFLKSNSIEKDVNNDFFDNSRTLNQNRIKESNDRKCSELEPYEIDKNENFNIPSKQNKESEIKFEFTNRLRFVPKGMSQIFQICQTKNVCEYKLDKEYYEEILYNNFADDVRMNAKIFEPDVQNVKELTTKAVEKVGNRLSKDHASLVFTGENLKNAMVLGQIDNKFIAAKLKGRTHQHLEMVEFLVLFDQHAVHERIRLENNLSDYLQNDRWKSTALEEITLQLSKDEILYLHNFADKFNHLGLEWNVLGNKEITIKAIPQAILGKNPRQVEVVMKSVRNLIIEEINTIKTQSGCISLYPKAIMDLVFSEACRYAIKFGDKLSIASCVDLLNLLSECKTPFQCAHGRPVMAVLMEIKKNTMKYKVNMSRLVKWVRSNRKQ